MSEIALTRRRLLVGAGGIAGAGVVAAAGFDAVPWTVRRSLGLTPDPYIPPSAEGQVELATVRSEAMGGDVDLFTAVPAGFGDGAGLPVVVVLHGASASAGALRGLGLGRFVTAAVEAGAPPFVLAGTDDGPAGWVAASGADPRAMLRDELPGWLSEKGYAAGRRSVWGWSRGGYGALRLALESPAWARRWAMFSPAVSDEDPALADLSSLAATPLGVWCGTEDGLYDEVRAVVDRLPTEPEVETYAEGGHTRVFWNAHTIEALRWLVGPAERLDHVEA